MTWTVAQISARAKNKANDLNSTKAGWAYFRMSNYKALNFGIFLIALAALGVFFLPAVAGGEEGTIPATVQIRTVLTLTRTEDLNFGQIRSGDEDGTVTVTPLNERFASEGIILRALTNFSRAEFIITGDPDAFYNITPVLDFALHDQGENPIPGETILQVTNLLSYSTTVGAVTLVGQFDPNGVDSVYVGGTLLVPAGAKFGKYGGEVTLTFNY